MGRKTRKQQERAQKKSSSRDARMKAGAGTSKYASKNQIRRRFKDGTSDPARDHAGNYVVDTKED